MRISTTYLLTVLVTVAASADTPVPPSKTILQNGSFEEMAGSTPRHWSTSVWGGTGDFAVSDNGRERSRCLRISSAAGGDVSWGSKANVNPDGRYRLSGWIRTDDVKPGTGRGAQLSVHELGKVSATQPVTGTATWRKVQVEFDTLGHKSISVHALLGGWGQSTGTAWFDDIHLEYLGETSKLVEERGRRWSKEKAWQWYNAQPWINGCNYLPSYAGNSVEFWQADTFDAEIIDQELALAAAVGYNSIRVLLQYLVWENNPEAYKRRFQQFLEIADQHGISVMPQFFDDCAFGIQPDPWKRKNPYLGKQDDPIPGGFFPNWAPSPGHSRVSDESAWPRLKKYMLDFMETHKDDRRILAWDLYNEPTNGGMGNNSLPLLKAVFQWARDIEVSQPITSGAWNGDTPVSRMMLAYSDIVTFHQYPAPDPNRYKETGRPVICTEWMIRVLGANTYPGVIAKTLPLLKEKKIGSYSWGLVNGRSQAQFQWGSKPGTPEPDVWFTDIFRDVQGTPYDPKEIEVIRRVSGSETKNRAQQSPAGDALKRS